ncbi:autotransporter outer membrane beta-barrel domain-containing protein [Tenacibaculum singaporense]|uniref:autotransporter outer membrane beta-barrel domain-containing protein n=1 Tax=Tenacibaculum singaporense TaxID=2358479 RepID=UPI001FC9F7BE|nr:autotransporter outer membrane beta-barrel domain-containing protein [Tenacibaculum singaporense]
MMKKQFLFILITILSFNSYSQISFEKGYYIDNTNQKTNCLIKNFDWKNNPTEFEYKLSENSESKKATIKSIKEFGIDNITKYIRSTVNIDRSSENTNNLSNHKNPIFQKEELFLKVLIEGKANLYQYIDSNLKRYFYNKENSNIEQLIFKSYKTTENNIGENNRFRQQLWLDLKCPNFKTSKIENVKYKKNDLVRFFTEYSECYNNELIIFEPKQKRDLFNLTIRPRINSSSLAIQNSVSNSRNTDFKNKIGFGLGLEAEYILPFNKNKWAITIEPTYQSFKSEKTTEVNNVSGGILIANVDYSSIEIPVGLRHYFFLNNNSKIFINASFIFDLNSKSSIEFTRNDGSNLNSLEIETRNNLAMGIGYKQNDRYSLEFRYQTNRELLGNYSYWTSEYKTLSIIFGYSLF